MEELHEVVVAMDHFQNPFDGGAFVVELWLAHLLDQSADVLEVVDHFAKLRFRVVFDEVVVSNLRFEVRGVLVRFVLVTELVDVPVQGVDVTVGLHAKHGFVVVVAVRRLVGKDLIVELVVDPKLQTVLFEERDDVLDRDAFFYVFLCFANCLEDRFSGDYVSGFVGSEQIVVVVVVDAVEEALVLDVPLLRDRVLEGARLQVELGRGEAVVGGYLFGVLVSRLLWDELPVARGIGVENVEEVQGS